MAATHIPRPRPVYYAGAGLLSIAAIAGIFYWMFSRFSPWDDDGYLLIGIRSLLNGHRLYDEIYTQYGPFYYLAHWITYTLTGQPVTHDTERLIGAVLWLCSAACWARVTWLLTRSFVCTAFGLFLGFKLLEFFPWSAGHPEEICMALLAGCAVIACGMRPATTRRDTALLACVLAALTLTKINIGIYIAIAIALFLLCITKPSGWRRAAWFALATAGLALPAALMYQMFGLDWARNYAIVATAATGAALLASRVVEPETYVTAPVWRSALVYLAASTVIISIPFFLRGTTLRALLAMTLLQHAGAARNWYLMAHIGTKVMACMAGSLSVLALAYWKGRGLPPAVPGARAAFEWVRWSMLGLKVLTGAICLSALATRNIRADNPIVFCYCVPFVWLMIADPVDKVARDTRTGRMALCFISVFAYLYAFPVAGAQVLFSSVPAGIAALIILRDAAVEVAGLLPAGSLAARARHLAPLAACVLLAVLFAREVFDGYRKYAGGVSLGMRGAGAIRVEPREAAAFGWIVRNVGSCSALYSMPGQFSLNFWSALDPPTQLTAGNWVALLDTQQQSTVVRDLSRYPGLCIVYNPELVELWRRGQDLSRSVLAQYIRREFVAVAQFDGYYILKRKYRPGTGNGSPDIKLGNFLR